MVFWLLQCDCCHTPVTKCLKVGIGTKLSYPIQEGVAILFGNFNDVEEIRAVPRIFHLGGQAPHNHLLRGLPPYTNGV